MRVAMTCESLVARVQWRSTRAVTTRQVRLRSGVTRMSLPQAEQIKRPGTRKRVCASQAKVPCDVR